MEATNSANVKYYSEVFYNFAVGFGAIGGGIFAIIKLLISYYSNRKRATYKESIKKEFPRRKLNKTFKLIDTEEAPGRIYIIDLKSKKRHWIQSASTLLDLDLHWDDVQRITKQELESYTMGAGILTSGEPGS